jgi:hypothetical protein
VAQQKRSERLDMDFRGDSMNKNKLFGPSVIKKLRRYAGFSQLAELS